MNPLVIVMVAYTEYPHFIGLLFIGFVLAPFVTAYTEHRDTVRWQKEKIKRREQEQAQGDG